MLRPDLNGQVLRLEPNGDLFFVIDGKRCLLSGETFKNLFRATVEPKTLPNLGNVPEGMHIEPDAELVQTANGDVFLACQGLRRLVNHQVFIACGFDWDKVIGVPIELAELPLGSPLIAYQCAEPAANGRRMSLSRKKS